MVGGGSGASGEDGCFADQFATCRVEDVLGLLLIFFCFKGAGCVEDVASITNAAKEFGDDLALKRNEIREGFAH